MLLDIHLYSFTLGEHNGKNVIWVVFAKESKLIADFRNHFQHAKWSQSNKKWYLPDIKALRIELNLPTKTPIVKYAQDYISEYNQLALIRYVEELKLRAYSPNTIQTYCSEFSHLLGLIKTYEVDKLSPEKLRSYFLYCINVLKVKENHLHSRINAVKFYFEKVLKQEQFFFEIPRPKRPSTLPKVISTADISKLFKNVENPKHSLMLKLCYGMGLRVSEIVKLKITDIDSKRLQVLVEAAKGKKDRYVSLPEIILPDLRTYYLAYKPKEYLFEGQYGGQYSIRSVQSVFKQTMLRAKINKAVGIHSLRHSYATHLLEYGTDISHIQKLLGHNDIRTTLSYTHVSKTTLGKIKSPLDRLTDI